MSRKLVVLTAALALAACAPTDAGAPRPAATSGIAPTSTATSTSTSSAVSTSTSSSLAVSTSTSAPLPDPAAWEADGPPICVPEPGSYPLGALDPAAMFGPPAPAPDLGPGVVRLSPPAAPIRDQGVHVDGDLMRTDVFQEHPVATIGRYDRSIGTFTRLVTFPTCGITGLTTDGTVAWALVWSADGEAILAVDVASARMLWQRRVQTGGRTGDRNDNGPLHLDGGVLRVDLVLPAPSKPNARVLVGLDPATGATTSAAPIAAADREVVPSDQGTWELQILDPTGDAPGAGVAELQELDATSGAVLRSRRVPYAEGGFTPSFRIVDGRAWAVDTWTAPATTTLVGYPVDAPDAPADRIELDAPSAQLLAGAAGVFAIGYEELADGRVAIVVQQVDLANLVTRATTRIERRTAPVRNGRDVGGALTVSATGLLVALNAVGGEPEGPQLAEIPAVR